MQPVEVRDWILKIQDLIFKDIKTSLAIGFFLLIIFWFAMSKILNVDDRAWQTFTMVLMVFFFYALIVLIGNGLINIDWQNLWQSIIQFL
jgi:hypothetical protein